ncbi:D-amino-acid N-acetyltransferase [Geosmithia morbida]|uniref:D-amino-acid N-acetyltransferase n=1 Tax=Geosmithia morbida TaxID=1094350 RepID=A0A9P4YVA3_9HYPO|nr:D-amino-acid N-acetyltransferase [Geosmithia morbida]KAF4122338.1 D-amino-acid N-acetyltransferase [Geosmithia morbida]
MTVPRSQASADNNTEMNKVAIVLHTNYTKLGAADMPITTRFITADDEPKWRHYWTAYNEWYKRDLPEDVTTGTFARFLDDKVQMYCAVAEDENKQAIGFVTWFPHLSTASLTPTVYLNDLFVDPVVRGEGAGGKLIDFVYEHAKTELGAKSVYWHTQHFNHSAQLLYVKKADKSDFVHYKKIL